jgi:O-succinylbenzoic acid--CoA ligase
MAGRLGALGVEPGDHLGAVLPPRVGYVCLVHAAMRVGATLVPLGDGLTARELGRAVRTADLTTLVCGQSTEEKAVAAVEEVPVVSLDDPAASSVTGILDVWPNAVDAADWSFDDVQLILFTSGTTGDPKAVELTTGNLLASAVASVFRLGFDPGDRWLVPLSLHHMGGIAPVLRMPLYGMTVVLRTEFEAGATADDVDRYDVTAVSLVPTMLRRMLDSRGTLSSSLRVVLLGGAPAPRELVERCRDYSVPVNPTYGMTETASQVATARPREAYDHEGTVGRPLYWTDVTVVDEEGTPLPRGERGELVVDGPTVTPGYYDDEAATREAFCEYGLKTGDVGYLDDEGRVYVLNRTDDRIVTGGENVDPGEVVGVLCSHDRVEAAAVVGLPDDEWGERVAALVVPTDDDLSRDELDAYCRDRLAGFKLPRTVAFAEELPRTVSGTVEREAVRERLAAVRDGEDGDGGVDDVDSEGTGDEDGGSDDADEETSPDAGEETSPDAGRNESGPDDPAATSDETDSGADDAGEASTDETDGDDGGLQSETTR